MVASVGSVAFWALLTGFAFGGCGGASEVINPPPDGGVSLDSGLDADANPDANPDANADAGGDAAGSGGSDNSEGGMGGQAGAIGQGGEAGTPLQCDPNKADCDHDPSNGCETDLTDVAHCGSCDTTCTLDHATAKCQEGACAIDSCDAGYGDCDGQAKNGCETPLNTLTDCGACAKACTVAGGAATCESGTCTIATCDTGAADCDKTPDNGCETPLNTLTDCGTCGAKCALANATATCGDRTCQVQTCSAGFDNCDKLQPNGCETSLKQVSDCGACGKACTVANGTPSCTTGTCAIGVCTPGYGDCNAKPADGCEVHLNSLTNCGKCGQGCSLANATATCSTGSCAIGGCASGYGNCDGQTGNGCETKLNTSNNCGACGRGCSLNHASSSCSSGSCQITGCDSGWGDCNGIASDGCEQQLGAYYYDADLDGYGGGYAPVYACSQPSHYSSNNWDCYDGNADARPGQTAFFTTNRGDGSFDYDCANGETKEWTSLGGCSADCTTGFVGWCEAPGFACDLDGNAVPACGASGIWTGSIPGLGALCVNAFFCTPVDVTTQTQACH